MRHCLKSHSKQPDKDFGGVVEAEQIEVQGRRGEVHRQVDVKVRDVKTHTSGGSLPVCGRGTLLYMRAFILR